MNNILYIGCLNARSLLPSMHDVQLIVAEHSFDIFIICETWLKKIYSNELVRLEGYTLYRLDRGSAGGGLCIYVKSNINSIN